MLSHHVCELQHLRTALYLLQEVRPLLHHLRARFQVKGVIIGSTHRISWSVRELQLDVFVHVTLVMEQRGASPRKPCPVIRPLNPIRSRP